MSDLTPQAVPATGTESTPLAGTTPSSGTPAVEPPKTFPEEYVKTLRGENADTRAKLRDVETKLKALELEKMTAEERKDRELADYKAKAEALETQIVEQSLRLLRSEAVSKHKLPANWIDRLKGTTAAEIDADAAEVAKDLAPPKAPNTEAGEQRKTTKTQTVEQRVAELKASGDYAAF